MRIACPLCGPRDRREFYYLGDAIALRRPAPQAGAQVWDDYLHNRDNPAGITRGAVRDPNVRATTQEIWDGLEAHAQNCWPSRQFDSLAADVRAAIAREIAGETET
ncbi:MAG: sarcosine oxidase subunit delta [Rhodobacteraceae bacterium]|nr:sarcosine oxidase subunit delta [Paracoccaceae bacterium]